jgi:hypothetical protein
MCYLYYNERLIGLSSLPKSEFVNSNPVMFLTFAK